MTKLATDQVGVCIRWWQHVLNVEHWRIDHRIVSKDKLSNPTSLMEFRPTRARMHALILIREDVLVRFHSIDVQKLLVHEITHLIYDPIAEEHGLQSLYCMDKVRADENKYRFTQVLEKAVEHTAQMLCKALPIRDQDFEFPHDPLEGDDF